MALAQARMVADQIARVSLFTCEIVIIKTSGDRLSEAPIPEAGGKRLFVKELEDALLSERVDIAVHSAKDMPGDLPDGLEIGATLPREEPWDALVLPVREKGNFPMGGYRLADVLRELNKRPNVGTSSVRRIAQVRQLLPDARFSAIRGNIDTRLRKLDEHHYDALVLAAAGLKRLGLGYRISVRLPLSICVPSPAQGAIAVQCRTAATTSIRQAVDALNDPLTSAAVAAERAVVKALGGGCQMPIGALARPTNKDSLELHAIVSSLAGERSLRTMVHGPIGEATSLGERAGAQLLAEGAADILEELSVDSSSE